MLANKHKSKSIPKKSTKTQPIKRSRLVHNRHKQIKRFNHSSTHIRSKYTQEQIVQGQQPVKLNYRLYQSTIPQPALPPLVILHGLLGHANNWTNIAGRSELRENRDIYTLDLRNHGSSPHTEYTDYIAMANDVAQFIQSNIPNGVATIVGHSMGGKAAAAVGLLHPHVASGIVLVDILPISYPEQNMEEIHSILNCVVNCDFSNGAGRREIDQQLSAQIPSVGIRQWLLTNIISIQPHEQTLNPISSGAVNGWKPNVIGLQQSYHNIRGFDLQQQHLIPYHGPSKLILGGMSSFGSTTTALDIMHPLFPECELGVIDNAGHWCHSEKPNEFTSELASFLKANHL